MAMLTRQPTFWILAALGARPLHGYGIINEAAVRSDGRVRLQAGALYAALDRLTGDGLIDIDHEETVEGRVRRYYRLSDVGATALLAETERLARDAEAALQVLTVRNVRPVMS